jgi:hypothetical protein
LKYEKAKKVFKIDDIVKRLRFSKRRIYDITNVLEGIGVLRKIEKNKIEIISDSLWVDYQEQQLRDSFVEKENRELLEEEKLLSSMIEVLKSDYIERLNSIRAREHFHLINSDLQDFKQDEDINLIGFSVPQQSSIYLPEPEIISELYEEKLKVI